MDKGFDDAMNNLIKTLETLATRSESTNKILLFFNKILLFLTIVIAILTFIMCIKMFF